MRSYDIIKPEEFIQVFKRLEQELGIPIRNYEETESLPEHTSKSLQVCRILRNYIQHDPNYQELIPVLPAGLARFLDTEYQALIEKKGIVKEFMTPVARYGLVKTSDTVFDLAILLKAKKHRKVPVLNDKGELIGIAGHEFVSGCLALGATKSSKIAKFCSDLEPAENVVDQNEPVQNLPDKGLFLVTNTKGKLVGVWERI